MSASCNINSFYSLNMRVSSVGSPAKQAYIAALCARWELLVFRHSGLSKRQNNRNCQNEHKNFFRMFHNLLTLHFNFFKYALSLSFLFSPFFFI